MIENCGFVCNTEYGDLCTYSNEACIGKKCKIYQNGLTADDMRDDADAMQEIRDWMNK